MSTDNEIREALAEVWNGAREVFAERVATIEQATRELAYEPADSELIETARSEAHKLAGVLGTFGLDRGSELANDLDDRLGAPDARDEAPHLRRLAAELRDIVEVEWP